MLRRISSSTPKHAIAIEIAQVGDGIIVAEQQATTDHYTYTVTLTAPSLGLRDWKKKIIIDTLKAITGEEPNTRTFSNEKGDFFEAVSILTPTTAIAEIVSAIETDKLLNKEFALKISYCSAIVRRRSSSMLSGTSSPRTLPLSPKPANLQTPGSPRPIV